MSQFANLEYKTVGLVDFICVCLRVLFYSLLNMLFEFLLLRRLLNKVYDVIGPNFEYNPFLIIALIY